MTTIITTPILRTLAAFAFTLVLLSARADAQPVTPTLDELFVSLGSAQSEMQADDIANKIWERWFSPDDPVLAKLMQDAQTARAYMNINRTMQILNQVIRDYPDYAEGWNRRATLNYELGNYQASLSDIEETLKREPRHFGALSGKALVYLALGDRTKAREAILAAREIHPFIADHPPFSDLVEPVVHL